MHAGRGSLIAHRPAGDLCCELARAASRVDVLGIALCVTPQRYLLHVAMPVQRGELDEGAIGIGTRPAVEADDDLVDREQQIMIRLLQGLGDGVKFALVTARVVRLGLARDGTDEVAVHAHGEAYHVHRLLDVG